MKFLFILAAIGGLSFGLRKQINYAYYKLFVKQSNMAETNKHIVQFVGFKTDLNKEEFIKRWTPFAENFKNAGIKTIDLYRVIDNKDLTFISRNIWDDQSYFQLFPTGVAGSGSGGGVSVTQFGGYWILESELEKPNQMNILFSNERNIFETKSVSRKRCTEKVRFQNQIEINQVDTSILKQSQPNILTCTHIKTM
jgi:hypothetical protein